MSIPEKQVDVPPEKKLQDKLNLGLEEMFDKSAAMANIRRSYEDLQGTDLKVCFLSFSIFPEGSVIRKRPLIYWWIGEGFITATEEKTAEEKGEEIFLILLRKDLIQPEPGESNCEVLVKNFTVLPWIRRMLISLAREARLFDFDSEWPMMPSSSVVTCRRSCLVSDQEKPITHLGDDQLKNLLTLFNVSVQYLDLKPEWLEKMKRVEVLHFGRWQSSHKYHIEVVQNMYFGSRVVGFLNGLGGQKHLKYLSLRGISGIRQLPDSVCSLISLEILDLKSCHDLVRLPSDISSLKKLTHLDVAKCYFLEGMPKELHTLSSLQVLKGFVIAAEEKTRFSDLAKLKYLRRLSIHIGNGAAVQSERELQMFQHMSYLRHLKISWGVVSQTKREVERRYGWIKRFLFPLNLEKLDLEGFPLSNTPDGLRPSGLRKLKKLYIRGGELCSLYNMQGPYMHDENFEEWKVEILRLKYLRNMRTVESNELKKFFPHLKYWIADK